MQRVNGSGTKKQNRPLHTANPFIDKAVVKDYEAWYTTIGRRADCLEKALLKQLLRKFPGANSLLEIGCGTAHFTRWFENQGLKVLGMDISRPMLEKAKSLASPFCLLADALKLPLAENSFDLTAIITTLEFLSDPIRGLSEALRVSKMGLILGALNSQSTLGRRIKFDRSSPWINAHLFSLKELIRLVQLVDIGYPFKIYWQTTLWPLIPFSLPLPWGSFIGLSVRIN